MKGKAGVIKDTLRYSEAFKLQVLRELEEGRWEVEVRRRERMGSVGTRRSPIGHGSMGRTI